MTCIYFKKERSDFLDKAEVAYQLQVQAQDAAEKAIKQLEEFITEDAKIVFFMFFFIVWQFNSDPKLKIFSSNNKGSRKCRKHNTNIT